MENAELFVIMLCEGGWKVSEASEKWTQIQAGKCCKLTKEETRH